MNAVLPMPHRFSDRRRLFLFLMAAPAVVYVAAIGLWPLSQGIWYSFYRYNLLRPARTTFVGLQNYVDIFTDETTRTAILNTFQFTIFSVGLQLIFGFCLALLLWRDSRFNRAVLAFLLVPSTITPLVVGLIFKALLGADYGMIGYFLSEAGIGPRTGLLTDASTALWVLILIDCWEWTPLMTLILLAGLKALPADLLEAGTVDGATAWQRFRLLILPLMLPSIFLALTLRTMDAFRVFDSVFVTTGGGPNDATNTLMMLGVKEGLQFFNVGYASAVGNVTLLFIALIATVLLLVVRRADVRINGR
ncbi:multiple sugar transport system permease protein [Rhizobium viscosum]|uniref:Multiple sugar transport system permease protein n=2 Tax=Rhizobium viscosum TaxID=1673 RepID=A0ABR9IY73_RHIVS|nr:multiple sugar transport system permease protein [Rhizobium viscosum]